MNLIFVTVLTNPNVVLLRIIIILNFNNMDITTDTTLALHNRGSHLTRQRLLVLDILKEVQGHPDAVTIFQEAKKRDDRISLATVYRSLAVLKEAGLIEENRLGEDHGHFETIQEPHHYHFTCAGCGRVIEFEASMIPVITQEVSEQNKLQVTEISFHLRGYCPDCQNNIAQP